MVQRLILMRHAKSSWQDPFAEDHARKLNPRGIRSARALGDWLRAKGHLPDEVLCSDARRTQETYAGLELATPVTFLPGLYHASADQMMDALQRATGGTVLMIGHNPGIADFAARLLDKAPDHPRFHDYPTGATLIADFALPWEALTWGSGTARDFVVPRELA